MTRFELTINGRRLSFSGPSKWALLSPAQAVALMRFREQVRANPAVIFPALQLLYGFKQRHMQWLFDERFLRRKGLSEADRELALGYGQAIIDTIRWTGETEPNGEFLVPHFRVLDFHFGSLSVLAKRTIYHQLYYAPATDLENCSFGEFMRAEQSYQAGDLVGLTAVLYRPTPTKLRNGTAEDILVGMDTLEMKRRESLFARLEPALLSLIAMQYVACQWELQRCFPHVFLKKETLEERNDQKSAGKKGGTWLDVAINMAKLDVTKVGEIERVNVYLALKTLDEQIRQADELEAELGKMKK